MKDGGPAFPRAAGACPGMSMRDYFAAAALTGLVSSEERWKKADKHSAIIANGSTNASIAGWAYILADAMLAERAKEPR